MDHAATLLQAAFRFPLLYAGPCYLRNLSFLLLVLFSFSFFFFASARMTSGEFFFYILVLFRTI